MRINWPLVKKALPSYSKIGEIINLFHIFTEDLTTMKTGIGDINATNGFFLLALKKRQ